MYYEHVSCTNKLLVYNGGANHFYNFPVTAGRQR